MIEIKYIQPQEAQVIRKNELRRDMTLPTTLTGDDDSDSFHLGLFVDSQLATIVSFMRENHPEIKGEQYRLRGMATSGDFKRKGYGSKIVLEAEKILQKKNIEIVWCDARVKAVNFYSKLGFKKIGKEFDVPQIGGHFVMYKKIN